ncbi:MAG: hypothetical protein JOZ81_13430 [Chloroflexi bacterium]|nr:hypothetical protein [Chloroflexota bacterium]MBV9544735.1 hypothetical protein [Chloroflexota bacterium]
MQLEFNDQEVATLASVLEQSLSGVREEIYKSETADYKDALRQRERILQSVLQRVRDATSAR